MEPGCFRTSFLSPGALRLLAASALVRESEAAHQQLRGNQPGDPAQAAAIIRVAADPNPPLQLLSGQDAHDMAGATLTVWADEMARWQALTVSTGFAPPAAA